MTLSWKKINVAFNANITTDGLSLSTDGSTVVAHTYDKFDVFKIEFNGISYHGGNINTTNAPEGSLANTAVSATGDYIATSYLDSVKVFTLTGANLWTGYDVQASNNSQTGVGMSFDSLDSHLPGTWLALGTYAGGIDGHITVRDVHDTSQIGNVIDGNDGEEAMGLGVFLSGTKILLFLNPAVNQSAIQTYTLNGGTWDIDQTITNEGSSYIDLTIYSARDKYPRMTCNNSFTRAAWLVNSTTDINIDGNIVVRFYNLTLLTGMNITASGSERFNSVQMNGAGDVVVIGYANANYCKIARRTGENWEITDTITSIYGLVSRVRINGIGDRIVMSGPTTGTKYIAFYDYKEDVVVPPVDEPVDEPVVNPVAAAPVETKSSVNSGNTDTILSIVAIIFVVFILGGAAIVGIFFYFK